MNKKIIAITLLLLGVLLIFAGCSRYRSSANNTTYNAPSNQYNTTVTTSGQLKCSVNSDCGSSRYCSNTVCVDKKSNSAYCISDQECSSGKCVSNYCGTQSATTPSSGSQPSGGSSGY